MDISSTQNYEIKQLLKLSQKSSERRKKRTFLVEGVQENQYALAGGYQPLAFYLGAGIWQEDFDIPKHVRLKIIDPKVYQKIAYRGSTEGVLGLYQYSEKPIDFETSDLILVLENIEKPGNLGAILRSALAFNVQGIILSGHSMDLFNPNVIRASVGTVFSLPIQQMQNTDVFSHLKNQGFSIFGTDMHSKHQALFELEFPSRTALLFGAEHAGISEFWENKLDTNYLIPMHHDIDSLNLSNAVAISLYQYDSRKRNK